MKGIPLAPREYPVSFFLVKGTFTICMLLYAYKWPREKNILEIFFENFADRRLALMFK
jgi:hypothetical protein